MGLPHPGLVCVTPAAYHPTSQRTRWLANCEETVRQDPEGLTVRGRHWLHWRDQARLALAYRETLPPEHHFWAKD